MKIKHCTTHDGQHYGYRFHCPGCDRAHVITTKPYPNGWDFDGNEAAPTFSPSILVFEKIPETEDPKKLADGYKPGDILSPRCHSFVRAGRIEFLSDCGHALAGKTVDLPDIEEK